MKPESGGQSPPSQGGNILEKYEYPCGYIYNPEVGDPEGGIAPGTKWEDIRLFHRKCGWPKDIEVRR